MQPYFEDLGSAVVKMYIKQKGRINSYVVLYVPNQHTNIQKALSAIATLNESASDEL